MVVGQETAQVYRRYGIVDQAMLRECRHQDGPRSEDAASGVSLDLLLQRRNNRCDEDARIDRLWNVMMESGGKRPEAVIRPSVSRYRNGG